ncbi:HAMP domain-containing histidine kinase [Candidatus Binatia bacterium]|nr:HAMP domain-containing histidine kinase [Candidatus Binatia bacterium]
MDSREQHVRELEKLARARLPLAAALLLTFLVGAIPIEAYYYPWHLRGYFVVLGVESALSLVALLAARWWPHKARLVATVWSSVMGICVLAYYPLVDGDATLALAAVLCVISAMPAILPFGLRHQLALCASVTLGLIGLVLMGVTSALPFPYLLVALLAVGTMSMIGTRSLESYRLDAMQREAVLRQAHEQLRLALVRAEGAVELRSRLVANVSHELRTPVNVIVGYADMVLDGADDPKTVRSLVRRIRRYAVSLDALIAQLLDLSRLSCAKVELVTEPIDLGRVVEEIAHDARLLTRGKPVAVTATCTVGELSSDPLRLRQILNNLVTNAARATRSGRIAIDAHREHEWLVLTVADTGCGISPEKHAAIFDAFEQVGAQSPDSGIGLGLAIVRQLVEVLGGEVSVKSALGEGATFTVRLPVWRPPEQPRIEKAAALGLLDEEEPLAPDGREGTPAVDPASLAGGSASAL